MDLSLSPMRQDASHEGHAETGRQQKGVHSFEKSLLIAGSNLVEFRDGHEQRQEPKADTVAKWKP